MKFTEIFTSKRLFFFVIQDAWISKLVRDAASQLSCRLKKVTYFKGFCYLNSHFIRKGTALMFMSSLRDEFSKTQWHMFLLVSGGHVGAHPDGHQHDAFVESALITWVNNFLKCFTCEKSHWPESRRESFYSNLTSFLRFLNLSFYFYFSWRDSENQQSD